MHLCSLCCAPRCCARNGWTESHDHFPDSANAPAILPNESYNFNNSLSRIPNSKKKSFLFSHLFVFQVAKKFTKSKSSVHFVQIQWSSFDQRNLDRRGDLFHRPWTTSRPRRGSFSSFSHPARGYAMLCVSSKEEEEAVLQPRRRKGEARSQSGEGGQATTSSTNLDGARVQVGSTGWWCHSISPFSKNTNCRKWRQRTLVLVAACCCCCCCTKRSTCRALLLLLLVFLWGYRDR